MININSLPLLSFQFQPHIQKVFSRVPCVVVAVVVAVVVVFVAVVVAI